MPKNNNRSSGSLEPLGTTKGIMETPESMSGHLANTTLRGYSAYEVAVEHGFEGTEGEWLLSLKGETGETPNIGIGNVYTGDPGTYAEVTITGTKEEPRINMKIPQGAKGDPGNSPVITASKSGDETTILSDGVPIAVIRDGQRGRDGSSPVITADRYGTYVDIKSNGQTIAYIYDGQKGEDGQDGEDGHSPVITGQHEDNYTVIFADGSPVATILDGQTPIITASKSNGTTTVYVNGSSVATINDGEDGNVPVITSVPYGKYTELYADGNLIATINDGKDGVSPNISISEITGGHRVGISDGSGSRYFDVMDGADGQDGHSPVLTATKSGKTTTISSDGTQIATILDGADGQDGQDGDDGFSPTATVTKSGKVATITITDKNGTTTATVSDGADGQGTDSPWSAGEGTASAQLDGASARGSYSVAEGDGAYASGYASHAEGVGFAVGDYSHAEGYEAYAEGSGSHAEGYGTVAAGYYQHVGGSYNIPDDNNEFVEIIGNGANTNNQSNARTLDWNGNEVIAGKLTVGAAPTNAMDVATKQYVDNASPDLTNYVTNADYATSSTGGVIKVDGNGLVVDSGVLKVQRATYIEVKKGTNDINPVVPLLNHYVTFYGLAKAAGDTTQVQSSNAFGTYTDEAKTAIRNMIGISDIIDNTLSVTGKAADAKKTGDEISDIETAITYSPENLLQKMTPTPREVYGVTYSYDSTTDTYTASGTRTGNASMSILSTSSPKPDFIVFGETYQLVYDTTDENVSFELIYKLNGSYVYMHWNTDTTFTLPADATEVGLRLIAYSGTVIDATIKAKLYKAYTWDKNKVLDLYNQNRVFELYTDFEQNAGWWTASGTLDSNGNHKHTQLLPIRPGVTYYTGYKIPEYDVYGIFYDKYGEKLSYLTSAMLTEHQYQLPDGTGEIARSNYSPMFKFTAPHGAYFISFNFSILNNATYNYTYRNYLASKPIFASSTYGDLVLTDDNPIYKKFGQRKLAIIGTSQVMVDRYNRNGYFDSTNTASDQFVSGFQEYLMPYWAQVDSYGYSNAQMMYSSSESPKSIYTRVVTDQLDLSQYDDIYLTHSSAGVTDSNIGTITSPTDLGDNTTYLGAVRQIIEYIYTQNPKAHIYLQTRYIRSQFDSATTLARVQILNGGIRDFADMMGIDCVADDLNSGFNYKNAAYWCYDSGGHYNQYGSKMVGQSVLKALTCGGVSVGLTGYVKNTNYATDTAAGVVKISTSYGIGATSSGFIYVDPANSATIKLGSNIRHPIVPNSQHEAVFYGLARAAGDTTQSASENTVGTYTDGAKTAIRSMIGTIGDADYATSSKAGIVRVQGLGIAMVDDRISISKASSDIIKSGSGNYNPVVPGSQHESVFYGLAKAAGDTTQSQSDNAVGTYTDDAKAAIRSMLDAISIDDIPTASSSVYGKVKTHSYYGTQIYSDSGTPGVISTYPALGSDIRGGSTPYRPITPNRQHAAVFFGLAKAAGDVTQSASENAVGTYTDDAKSAIRTMLGALGNTNYATTTVGGVVKADGYGMQMQSGGFISTKLATSAQVKAGTHTFNPIVPGNEHEAVFYGLAKASGDSTQAASNNSVGAYTDDAKASIRTMLDVEKAVAVVTVSGATPTVSALANTIYKCGEVTALSFTPCASGICDIIFTSGTTPTVLTIPNTVKLPGWFDPANIETNTTYEINVLDGVYGAVTAWAV